MRDKYAILLADHHRIMRETFANWNGHEVDTQGDAFFVAFSRATQAVSAAAEIQRKLAEHIWPERVAVQVRMGIHTGESWTGSEGYAVLRGKELPQHFPAILLTSGIPPLPDIWRKCHKEMVMNSEKHRLLIAEGNHHDIVEENPELVIQTIVELIGSIS